MSEGDFFSDRLGVDDFLSDYKEELQEEFCEEHEDEFNNFVQDNYAEYVNELRLKNIW